MPGHGAVPIDVRALRSPTGDARSTHGQLIGDAPIAGFRHFLGGGVLPPRDRFSVNGTPPSVTSSRSPLSKAREARAGVSLYFVDIAPMASKSADKVQSSSSQPPAKTTSCLPIRMLS